MKRIMPLLAILFLVLFSGCMKKGLSLTGGNEIRLPLKKIWIMPFPVTGENQVSEKFGKLLEQSFAKDKSLFPVSRNMPDYADLPARLPMLPGSRINNSALSSLAEEYGIQAVGVYSVLDIKAEEKYTEVMFLSKKRWYIKSFFSFSIYDSETSSKLCDFYTEERVRISEEEYRNFSNQTVTIPENIVRELLEQAASGMAEKALEALSRVAWKGFVVGLNGNRAKISSGEETLLKAGDEIDISMHGQIFEGKDGFRYRIPGDKYGRLKIDNVKNRYSEAEIPSGMKVSPGMTVRFAEIKD